MLEIPIKRFDTSLPLPEYKTAGAAAFDLYARISVVIQPRSVGYVPLNIAIQLPPDHFAQMSARSSLHKKGVMMANGIGIGDADFSGDGDEYQAALFNFSDKTVTIDKGERIVQMIILKRDSITFKELMHFDTKNRGGFGSTGTK
ncbi:MAG: dUTP diphosphatase [Patescibacteria group bacterium]